MKGIILAGGSATRLFPLTHTTCKQLLPVYDRQMIFYPLETLLSAGIEEILVIVSPQHAGQFLSLLGPIFDGSSIKIQFKVQSYPRGLADAFIIGEDFIDEDSVALILGDNIFEYDFSEEVDNFKNGCHIFLKEVEDPSRYGVAKIFDNKIISIVEKPKPEDDMGPYAIPGFYLFDKEVCRVARNLSVSDRGEIEIVDAIRVYAVFQQLNYTIIDGEWFDAGTFDDLLKASIFVRDHDYMTDTNLTIYKGIKKLNDQTKELLRRQLKP